MGADHSSFDPSEVYVYRGKGIVPRNVRRAEVDRSVKFIPDRLFQYCRLLESVLLHEGLQRIGEWAFRGCSSLRILRCPSTVTYIGEGAFLGCSNLAEVDLPEGLRKIERATFARCTSLEDVRIPASVAWIGKRAFEGCTNLVSVDLREGLRMIGHYAFDGCSLLESLRVPSSVDEIGVGAFDNCSSLASVQLHENVPRMRRFAFRSCPLESFRFFSLSERMKTIRMDDQTKSTFESRLSEITRALSGADRNDEDEDDPPHPDDEEDAEAIQKKCKESLGKAHEVLTYFELKGALPVLELALWKAKKEGEGVQGRLVNNKDGGQDPSDVERERERPKVTNNIGQGNRLSHEDCRVKCGAGIVIPEVLKFFAYSSSWPRLDDSEEGNAN